MVSSGAGVFARRRRQVRRGLLGAGAVAALGALAACSAGVGASTYLSASAVATRGATPAAVASAEGQGAPAIVRRAVAHDMPARPAPDGERRRSRQPKSSNSPAAPAASASASATSASAATPTAYPSSAPTITPTDTASSAPTAAPTGSGSGADPSGQDPAVALPGFTRTYVQEFTGGGLPSGWGAYQGVPGGESSSQAQWAPGMCAFSGGEAHFMASGIDSCGMHYQGDPQEYGAWFARLQAPAETAGELFSDIFLLWPSNGQWPPEIDVYEDEGNRARTVGTLWDTVGSACGASPSSQCLHEYTQTNGGSDGIANTDTQWHTYGVEWTPAGVSWLIDGQVILTAPASAVKSPAQQPAQPMNMALQSQNLAGSAGAPSLQDTMNVDWVEQFSWNG